MVFNVPQNDLILELSKELESRIEKPSWAGFVKTGVHKERPPVDDNWWFVRAAAILRTVYLRGPIGVSKLRKKYGGRKNRGVKPEHFFPGSGSIARKILQQLEQAGLVEKGEVKNHKGRVITKEGLALINSVAKRLASQTTTKKSSTVFSKKKEQKSATDKSASKKGGDA